MISKLLGAYREAGPAGLAWRIFSYFYKKFVRAVLPRGDQILYAGIPVGHRKVGDQLLPKLYNPPDVNDVPGYEQALVSGLKAHVRGGDNVVVVGVGLGVTSVIAALAAAETGRVECFEGDLHGVDAVRRVARLNGVLERITAHHAVVGEAVGVYGNAVATTTIHPTELPSCDILELDCEGAEIGILRDMIIQPRAIAVETHGFLGAPTGAVRELLESRGYHVEDLGWAEPRFLNACVDNDIRVLVGTLEH
jgi:methyltransferase FkbM-like protein